MDHTHQRVITHDNPQAERYPSKLIDAAVTITGNSDRAEATTTLDHWAERMRTAHAGALEEGATNDEAVGYAVTVFAMSLAAATAAGDYTIGNAAVELAVHIQLGKAQS